MNNGSTKVACIGAGNLTKGLLYPLFDRHGYDVTIISLTPRSHESLQNGYDLREVGENILCREYADINTCLLDDMGDLDFKHFDIITTAVGSKNFQYLADRLKGKQLKPDVTLLLCENDIMCFDLMRFFSPNILMAVVDRIVFSDKSNTIVAESYFSFDVVKRASVPLPGFVTQVSDFGKAYTQKKYLVNALHAIVAWYGFCRGHSYINHAMQDKSVNTLARNAAEELTTLLAHKYPDVPPTQFITFAALALQRFSAAHLDDPILRVGRNALAKLGKNERLMEPVTYAKTHGLPYDALLEGASYGLLYHAETEHDPQGEQYESLISYIENIGAEK